MKIAILLTAAAAIGLVSLRTETAQAQGAKSPDLVEQLVSDGSFTTLVAALKAADLVETLRGTGPFTVFAPTDAAFAKLPKGTIESLLLPENRDRLVEILTTHVVGGRVDSKAAVLAGTAAALSGEAITVEILEGRLAINAARVTDNDRAASNGIVHVIDTVLLPAPVAANDSTEVAYDLLSLAVARGSELFNNGSPEGCAAVYEVVATALVELSDALPQAAREGLVTALRRSKTESAAEAAWVLRRAFEAVAKDLPRPSPASKAPEVGTRTIFDFGSTSAAWRSVNDDVMGGISRSSFEIDANGYAVFKGALSLENNGGFATVRSPARDLGLAGHDGLRLRVRGDGRTYGLMALRSDKRGEIGVWEKKFSTVAGKWQEIQIPFADLALTIMGQRVPGAPAVPLGEIRSPSFIIADKDESPFRLEVEWIRAYPRSPGEAVAARR